MDDILWLREGVWKRRILEGKEGRVSLKLSLLTLKDQGMHTSYRKIFKENSSVCCWSSEGQEPHDINSRTSKLLGDGDTEGGFFVISTIGLDLF